MFCTNGQIPSSILAFTSFYLHGSIASYASADIKADLSLRLSVCLSITLWYCVKTNGRAASRLHHRYIARKTLVFAKSGLVTKFQKVYPERWH